MAVRATQGTPPFASQAGREVRILVRLEKIDDLASMRLARDIVRKIEESLTYPGQIKVAVIRETRRRVRQVAVTCPQSDGAGRTQRVPSSSISVFAVGL